MQHLEVSGAVRHIYIYVIRRLKVNSQHVPGIIMSIVRRKRLYKTVCGVCLVVLAVVVWSWDANCVHFHG